MDKRFNPDCATFDDIVDYYTKRAKQLMRYGYKLMLVEELEYGAYAIFEDLIQKKIMTSLYIYPAYRGRNMFFKFMSSKNKPYILTSDDCGIEGFLKEKGYKYECINLYEDKYYRLISEFYGDRKAERSGVEYMNHIDEGLVILKVLGASPEAKAAFALHPLFQSDVELKNSYRRLSDLDIENKDRVILLAMEYRSVANEYLSMREIKNFNDIRLSPLKEVNQMLVADKIQNYKDFLLYHYYTHPRSKELNEYFNNWLLALDVSLTSFQYWRTTLDIKFPVRRLVAE